VAEAERLRQSLLADAGRGDLLKTIIDRVELRPNDLRMILSLVPLIGAPSGGGMRLNNRFRRQIPYIEFRHIALKIGDFRPE
jgi:hypothetical protein